jgi:hypothetical protein
LVQVVPAPSRLHSKVLFGSLLVIVKLAEVLLVGLEGGLVMNESGGVVSCRSRQVACGGLPCVWQ